MVSEDFARDVFKTIGGFAFLVNFVGDQCYQEAIATGATEMRLSETVYKAVFEHAERGGFRPQDLSLPERGQDHELLESGETAALSLFESEEEDELDDSGQSPPFALLESEEGDELSDSGDSPVIKLVNLLIAELFKSNGTEILLEPQEKHLTARFRIDGRLALPQTIPGNLKTGVISRLKIMGDLDVSERRVPQDGQFQIRIGERTVRFRISTVPTRHGEQIFLKALVNKGVAKSIDQSEFPARELAIIQDYIGGAHGLVLIAGPQDSGRRSTSYTILSEMVSEERGIITIADPILQDIPGVTQLADNPRVGLTLQSLLRASLLQEPDILMISDILDLETYSDLIRASKALELTLGILSVNDAVSAIEHTVRMGLDLEAFLSASPLIIAQRLVRKLCRNCRIADRGSSFQTGPGCSECHGIGYSGRTLLAEALFVDEGMKAVIVQEGGPEAILTGAKAAGFRTLREVGQDLVESGVTSQDEIDHVLP
jgi:general secretion pathway protein E